MSSLRDSPIVIGATGGSGTRLLHHILESAGIFMGRNNTAERDSLDFGPFLYQTIPLILREVKHLDYILDELPPALVATVGEGFAQHASRAERDVPDDVQEWGWKNPRILYLLPFVYARYPNVRLLHVVRDGRDMALSSNRNQVTLYYTLLFGRPIGTPPYASSIELWNAVNLQAARWAAQHLGARYHALRFEDLCDAPETTISRLLAWLERPASRAQIQALAAYVSPPETRGRWRQLGAADRQALETIAAEGLQRFGYLG